MSQVHTVFTSEDKDVIAALKRQGQEMAKLREQNRKLTEESKKGSKSAADGVVADVAKIASGYLTVTAAINVGKAALDFFRESNRKFAEESSAAILKMDEAFRKFRVQAGLTAIESDQSKAFISRAALSAGTSAPQAAAGATQLVSGGFSAQEALQGGGLDALLATMDANNLAGKGADATETAKALGLFLNATGQELTGANLRTTGVAVANLFKGTNLQLGDLETLAPQASTITNLSGLTGVEQLGVFAQLRQTLDPSGASTQFRNTVASMATAGGQQAKVDALKTMGLNPGDIDMVGETFTDALAKIKAATEGMAPEQANIALTKLFGSENLSGPLELMKNLDKVNANIALTSNEAVFEEAVRIAREGSAFDRRQAEARREIAFDRGDAAQAETLKTIMAATGAEGGYAPVVLSGEEFIFDTLRSFGISPESSQFGAEQLRRLARPGQVFEGRDPQMEENNRLLREQNDLLRQQRPTAVIEPQER